MREDVQIETGDADAGDTEGNDEEPKGRYPERLGSVHDLSGLRFRDRALDGGALVADDLSAV